MITYTGRSVWPDTDDPEAPSLFDIAAGLGRMPRFAGQTKIYYTVLAHTFVVTSIVSPEARIYALLHDAPEAVVADVPTPWKSQEAKDNEAVLMKRICAEHGVIWPAPDDLLNEVTEADYAALVAEAHVLGHSAAEEVWPSSEWNDLVWRARDETMRHVSRGCIWGLDPHDAAEQYEMAMKHALVAMRPDTIVTH